MIKSPTGKVYVGQSVNIEKRFLRYKKGDCSSQIALFNSLIKYGSINHSFEILEECLTNDLNSRERFYQDKYDVLSGNGLNCVLTESNGKLRVYSTETIERMSAIAKKRIISEIRRKHQSNVMKGRKLTDDHKSKISESNKGKDHYWKRGVPTSDYQKKRASEANFIKINQFTKDMIFIKEWDSLKFAGEILGINPKSISGCIHGRAKTAGKFIWRHA